MANNTTHSVNSYWQFVLGGNAYQPYSIGNASGGSNKDLLSKFIPTDGNTTGAIGSTIEPILYSYMDVVTVSSGTGGTSDGDYVLQLATSATGSGGVNHLDSNGNPVVQTGYGTKSFVPNFASKTGDTVYYGFYIVPGTGTVNFYREGSSDTTRNPDGIYTDGTLTSTGTPNWNTTAIYGKIRWQSVPNAPASAPTVSAGSNYADLSFPLPTDNGGSAITGYRILISPDLATWYSTDEITDFTNNAGTISLTVSGYYASSSATTLTALSPATNYYFQVAAINGVSKAHSSNFKDVTAHTGTNSAYTLATTLGYGKRFTSTAATTDIRYASRYTGNASDSVVVEGITYTGWTKVQNIKRNTSTGWTNLTG